MLTIQYFNLKVYIHPTFLHTEAATRGVLLEKVLLEISQNSQENTCVRVSCEFCEISTKTFFTEHLRTTASFHFFKNNYKHTSM